MLCHGGVCSNTSAPSPKAKRNPGMRNQFPVPEGYTRQPQALVGQKLLYPTIMAGVGNGDPALLCPKALGEGGDVLTGCLPCRGWLAWCPRLRTLLLDLLLIYISVPFLIRLFPVLLTKFVFLNFRECPGVVPTGRATSAGTQWAGGWGKRCPQNVGGAAPSAWAP